MIFYNSCQKSRPICYCFILVASRLYNIVPINLIFVLEESFLTKIFHFSSVNDLLLAPYRALEFSNTVNSIVVTSEFGRTIDLSKSNWEKIWPVAEKWLSVFDSVLQRCRLVFLPKSNVLFTSVISSNKSALLL